ncbi:MAG: ArsR/SmtB family transcription factor, partial [Acidimicrobiia bacterium]
PAPSSGSDAVRYALTVPASSATVGGVPTPGAAAPALDETAVVGVLRALGEPNRLRLLGALRQKERCVRDLVDGQGLPQPLVSHHLRVLAEAGLVASRRADGFTLYAVDPEGMDRARAALAGLLDTDALDPVARPGGNQACCAG